jgi:hypothetical protein
MVHRSGLRVRRTRAVADIVIISTTGVPGRLHGDVVTMAVAIAAVSATVSAGVIRIARKRVVAVKTFLLYWSKTCIGRIYSEFVHTRTLRRMTVTTELGTRY